MHEECRGGGATLQPGGCGETRQREGENGGGDFSRREKRRRRRLGVEVRGNGVQDLLAHLARRALLLLLSLAVSNPMSTHFAGALAEVVQHRLQHRRQGVLAITSRTSPCLDVLHHIAVGHHLDQAGARAHAQAVHQRVVAQRVAAQHHHVQCVVSPGRSARPAQRPRTVRRGEAPARSRPAGETAGATAGGGG